MLSFTELSTEIFFPSSHPPFVWLICCCQTLDFFPIIFPPVFAEGWRMEKWCSCIMIPFLVFFSLQWTVGGSKNKKKGKAGKAEKKGAMKKQMNKAASSGSSDKDSSAESSAPEEGKIIPVHLHTACTYSRLPSIWAYCKVKLSGDVKDYLRVLFSVTGRLNDLNLLWLQACIFNVIKHSIAVGIPLKMHHSILP